LPANVCIIIVFLLFKIEISFKFPPNLEWNWDFNSNPVLLLIPVYYTVPQTYFSFYIDCPLMLNPSLGLGEKSTSNLYSWPVMCWTMFIYSRNISISEKVAALPLVIT
jgi:hypothetical protein